MISVGDFSGNKLNISQPFIEVMDSSRFNLSLLEHMLCFTLTAEHTPVDILNMEDSLGMCRHCNSN